MHKVDTRRYERIRPIFADLGAVNLNIEAILDGTCRGQVYADDPDQPRSAFVQHGDAWYVAGDAGSDGFNTSLNAMLPRDHYFVLFCEQHGWERALETILDGTYAVRARRRHYVLHELELADWRERVPEGFSLRNVNAGILAEGIDLSPLEEWIEEEWLSTDAFLELGFGCCLVHGDEIASWSLADYVHGDRCEMGIQTRQNYRRQGFGTLTAAAAASQALASGYKEIGWHCWDNNVGSIGVAENTGFELRRRYDVFINHWVAENITDMSQDDFKAFARDYEADFVERPPESGYPHIVAATAWALGQDRAACFRHLNRTVDLGWLRDLDHLRALWPELFLSPNLDDMPEWRELIRRLETNQHRPSGPA